jgi:hypothetical protein
LIICPWSKAIWLQRPRRNLYGTRYDRSNRLEEVLPSVLDFRLKRLNDAIETGVAARKWRSQFGTRLAEGVGFEPTVPLQARRFSRPVP